MLVIASQTIFQGRQRYDHDPFGAHLRYFDGLPAYWTLFYDCESWTVVVEVLLEALVMEDVVLVAFELNYHGVVLELI